VNGEPMSIEEFCAEVRRRMRRSPSGHDDMRYISSFASDSAIVVALEVLAKRIEALERRLAKGDG
jgi:hypothetical protein